MSISNLFSPNDYSIFAKTMSVLDIEGDNILTNNIDTSVLGDNMVIGPVRANNITIGNGAGVVSTLSPLALQAGNSLLTHFSSTSFAGTGTICIPNTPNYISFTCNRVNNLVTVSWTFTGPAVNATAASNLTILETLPLDFRPFTSFQATCSAIGDSAAPLPVTAGDLLPAVISIDALGTISFHYMPVTHNNNITFEIGKPVEVASGSVSFRSAT